MKTLAIALLCASGLALAHAAPDADQPPTARDLHAAECVAALDVNTQALAKQVRAGKEAARALLLDRLVAGTAFVGDTWLHGNSDEKQARALANEALEAQKRLPPAELTARQVACTAEGRQLYDDSNGLEKVVVKRLAKKRMEKLLNG